MTTPLAEIEVKIKANLAELMSAQAKAISESKKLDQALAKMGQASAPAFQATAAALKEMESIQARINKISEKYNPDFGSGQQLKNFKENLSKIKLEYDPLISSQRKYQDSLSNLKNTISSNVVQQKQQANILKINKTAFDTQVKGIQTYTGAMNAATGAQRLNNLQLVNMQYQINDIGVMLASGQNPFVLIMQQGMQIAQIFDPGTGVGQALKQTGQGILSFLVNPINLTVFGLAAAAGAASYFWNAAGDGSKALSSLEVHNEWLDKTLSGYEEIREAAKEAQEEALKLSFGRTEGQLQNRLSEINSLMTEQQETVENTSKKWDNFFKTILVESQNSKSSLDIAYNETFANISERVNQLILDFKSGALTSEELSNKLAEIRFNEDVPDQIKKMIDDLYKAVDALVETEAQAEAVSAALKRMQIPSSVLRDIDILNDALSDLSNIQPARLSDREAASQAFNIGMRKAKTEQDIRDVENAYNHALSRISAEEDKQAAKEAERAAKKYARTARQLESNQLFIADLEREVEILGMTYSEREKAMEQFEEEKAIRDAIAQLGDTASADQIAKIRELIPLQRELNEQVKNEEALRKQITQTYTQMGGQFGSIFSEVIKGTKDAEEAMIDFGLAIAEAVVKAQLLKMFQNDPETGAFVQNIVGGLFGGFRAAGGPVDSSKAYVVGEKGPEMFVPNTSGVIVPNHKLSGGSSAQPKVNINIQNTVPNTEVKKQQGSNPYDMRFIVEEIKNEVKQDYATGGFDKPSTARFGFTPKTIGRQR